MIVMAVCAALLAAPAFAAPKAPNFKVARVLNAPVSKISGAAELKGKLPKARLDARRDVAGIPRTNRLIDALKGEPVIFLSVTDEPAEMIEAFRKTHEIKAWIGIDEAGSALKAYHVLSRPAGYLIGKDGTLLAAILPNDLKENDVRDALAGRFARRPVKWDDAPRRTVEFLRASPANP